MIKKIVFFSMLIMGFSLYCSKNPESKRMDSKTFEIPQNVTITNVTHTSATISWGSIASGSYILEYHIVGTGAPWTPVPTTLTSYTLTGLLTCVTYEVRIRDAANPADVSIMKIFTTMYRYCEAASADSGTLYISNVTVTPVAGISFQMSNNSGASYKTDYQGDPNKWVELETGSSGNSISVNKSWAGPPSPAAVQVWIDLNADGIFQDSERIMSSPLDTSPVASSTFSVSPAAAQNIAYCGLRMRVLLTQASLNPACGTFAYGEAEDYGITLKPATILAVSDLNTVKEVKLYPNPASDILNISATDGTEFEIYNAAGQLMGKGKISDGTVNVRNLVKGVYFIQIKDKNHVTKLKFIKK